MTWQILLARLRVPLLLAALVLVFVGSSVGIPWPVRLAGFLAAYFVVVRAGTVKGEPTVLSPPVDGRWSAVNSPADKVPSHGIQVYGQSYAIDLIHEPLDRERPGFAWWPLARRAADFPGFGQPVHAPADGVVVKVHSRERDHWSRNSWPSLLFLVIEGTLRELTGPNRVIGNHVTIQLDDGRYTVLAHLQRRSARVAVGDRVRAGDHVGDCGNSGNSSEPHLHLQVCDRRNVLIAAGLPMSFDRFEIDGTPHTGLPSKEQPFELRVPTPVSTPAQA